MQLLTVHKILIGASIAMTALFALWAGWMALSGRGDPARHVIIGALAVAVAVGLSAYLRAFVRKTSRPS